VRISPRPGAATQNARASSAIRVNSGRITRELQSSVLSYRWRLPAPPLRTSALIAAGSALALATLAAAIIETLLGTGRLYPIRAAGVCLLTSAVAIGYMPGHHPFATFGAANTVTMLRAGLVALLVALLAESHGDPVEWTATGLAIAITVLDGVDGWLARRSEQASAFGARFDMETDALLIMALAALAWRWERAGAWVLACGLMRYVFVAAAAPWRWLNRPLPPSLRRKTICVVQIVGLGAILAPVVTPPLSVWVAGATLAALSYSFLVDVLWLAARRPAR